MRLDFSCLLAAGALLCALGCQSEVTPSDGSEAAAPGCVASCEGSACGDDGCGGSCGDCAAGQTCTSDGQCAVDCGLHCAEAGLECGEHCGQDCGGCAAGTHCDSGQCLCTPQCAGKTCADDDGCGGTCEPCPRDVSCPECSLQLRLLERVADASGRTVEVVLAIEYAPAEGDPLPTLADLRLRLDGPAELRQVGIGAPLLEADKRLLADPSTGRPYRLTEDGAIRLLVMSSTSSAPIGAGRWVLLRVAFDTSGPVDQPLVARLVPREETLAPRVADESLWSQPLDRAVVVWPVDVSLPTGGDADDQ